MKAIIAILLSMVFGTPALAATFVYVSNADDGEIGSYTLQGDGSLNRDSASRRKRSSCR
jgi:6-phosphogluconolactonase